METAENLKLELVESMDTGFYSNEKSGNFVIDMESFSNSRITLQRSLSRKGMQRGAAISPTAAQIEASMPEKAGGVAVGVTTDHSSNPQSHHHQIAVAATTGNISTTGTTTENKCLFRRNSFRRTPSGGIDPKRVLIFFAILSSMGTIILIYLTLSNSHSANDSDTIWEQ